MMTCGVIRRLQDATALYARRCASWYLDGRRSCIMTSNPASISDNVVPMTSIAVTDNAGKEAIVVAQKVRHTLGPTQSCAVDWKPMSHRLRYVATSSKAI
jgi:hypothetical protein